VITFVGELEPGAGRLSVPGSKSVNAGMICGDTLFLEPVSVICGDPLGETLVVSGFCCAILGCSSKPAGGGCGDALGDMDALSDFLGVKLILGISRPTGTDETKAATASLPRLALSCTIDRNNSSAASPPLCALCARELGSADCGDIGDTLRLPRPGGAKERVVAPLSP
jgi:hypothetical protein